MRFNPDMICHVSLIHNCNPTSPLFISILRYQVALYPSKSKF